MTGRLLKAAMTGCNRLPSMILLLVPAFDIALIVAFAYPGRLFEDGNAINMTVNILTAMFFWLAAYSLCRAALDLQLREKRSVLSELYLLATVAAAASVVAYHLMWWAFTLSNGHPPSERAVSFLRQNAFQAPLHLLQTAPAGTLLLVVASMAAAMLLLRHVRRSLSQTPPPQLRRDLLQAFIFLVAWYVISNSTQLSDTHPSALQAAKSHVALDQAKAQIQRLPERPASTLTAEAAPPTTPVIVILVESLRHDLLETNPAAIPFIRQMYKEHLGLQHAYATASHSDLSDLAFWYSQYPLKGPGLESYPVNADWRGVSLFDLFKANGYRTAYISSQNELWGDMINWLKIPGVDFFFHAENHHGQTWENNDDIDGLIRLIRNGIASAGKVEDSETLNVAKQWIDSLPAGVPFFLGVNLQNTHFSYVLSPGASQPNQPSNLDFAAVYYRWPAKNRENVRNRYLNSVLNVDSLIADFADYLQQKGIWDDVTFVVLGDNGEAFYEHGFGNHSGPMYQEVVRTLAFIKPPRPLAISAATLSRPVSHIDIAATIPDLLGLARPWSFQGRSLIAHGCTDRPIFLYSNAIVRQAGLIDWPWKLLVTEFPEQREELFNLVADPEERENLASAEFQTYVRLRSKLEEWASLQYRYYSEEHFRSKSPPTHCETT